MTSEVPDWEGHEFLGWSTSEDSAFADYTAGDHYTLTAGDDILFAIWKAKTPQYTIEKSVANEGSGEGGTFKTGETINYKITVTNTGGRRVSRPHYPGRLAGRSRWSRRHR